MGITFPGSGVPCKVVVARMIRPIQQVSNVEAVKIAKGVERRRYFMSHSL
jgi:hypothetical protein